MFRGVTPACFASSAPLGTCPSFAMLARMAAANSPFVIMFPPGFPFMRGFLPVNGRKGSRSRAVFARQWAIKKPPAWGGRFKKSFLSGWYYRKSMNTHVGFGFGPGNHVHDSRRNSESV